MNSIRARDIMSKNVHHVSPRMHLIDLENDLSSHRISGAPVVDHGKVIGIVSRSDIDAVLSRERTRSAALGTFYGAVDDPPGDSPDPTSVALESLRTLAVQDIMTKNVISVAPDDSMIDVARLMSERRIHRVLVTESGELRGIIAALDIVEAVAESA
jgi:CBS domain-containing protein